MSSPASTIGSTIDGGVGYKALLGPVHTLRLDAGLGYTHENRLVGEDQSFALANFGAAYKWQISKTADLTDSAIFTASLDGRRCVAVRERVRADSAADAGVLTEALARREGQQLTGCRLRENRPHHVVRARREVLMICSQSPVRS